MSLQLALSAASPIYRGYLSDIDTRWSVISQSVDDRTREERGLEVTVLCLLFHHFEMLYYFCLSILIGWSINKSQIKIGSPSTVPCFLYY